MSRLVHGAQAARKGWKINEVRLVPNADVLALDQKGGADVNKLAVQAVEDCTMNDTTFPIEFIGGSRDGELIEAAVALDYAILGDGEVKEVYERHGKEAPFSYVQIGYAGSED